MAAHIDDVDYDQVAREVVHALRGRQTTAAVSMRLGYASDVARRWENGERRPYCDDVFRLCHLKGIDVRAALVHDYPSAEAALDGLEPDDPAFSVAAVQALLAPVELSGVAQRAGMSRQTLGRLARGETRPRFAQYLELVHVLHNNLRLLLGGLVSRDEVPSMADVWAREEALADLFVDQPFTPVLLAALSMAPYREAERHDVAWLSDVARMTPDEVDALLARAESVGLVEWTGTHWRHLHTEVRLEPNEVTRRQTAAFWGHEAAHRAAAGQADTAFMLVGFADDRASNVVEALHRGFHAACEETRKEQPTERLGVFVVQFAALDGRPLNLSRRSPNREETQDDG